MPDEAELGKCYKYKSSLTAEIRNIKNLGEFFNQNLLPKESALDDFEKQTLEEWFNSPDNYSDVFERWNGAGDKDYSKSILNELCLTNPGPSFSTNYKENLGFEIAISSDDSEVTAFMYKTKDFYNIIIYKEN